MTQENEFIEESSEAVIFENMSKNIVWQRSHVSKGDRAKRLKQKPVIIWFTGLSGSGKSTMASALERALFSNGYLTYLLDGDNVRHGLCSDLGFSDGDRSENIRRVGEVAKLFLDAGYIILTSFISPFVKERDMVRLMVEPEEFVEVYVNASFAVCEERDVKGLYKKARAGQIKNFTGLNSPYEKPEFEINTENTSVDDAVNSLLLGLKKLNIIL